MRDRTWCQRGPRILGYEPGWLWWAAVLVVVIAGLVFAGQHFKQTHRNRAYLEARAAHYADEQGLDLSLVRAVVQAESSWDWQAQSGKDARGLMQVTPIALADVRERFDVGRGDLFDVDYNLRVGTLYLAYLLKRFEGDVTLAVAAYHMGPTAVAKGLRENPGLASDELVKKIGGPQTRAYVDKVLGLYESLPVTPAIRSS